MNTFETSALVEADGEVRVRGVPFEPGTQVEITMTPVPDSATLSAAEASERAARLFAALDKARNNESVGPLRREELYDRRVLR